jgi:hypothetical protein
LANSEYIFGHLGTVIGAGWAVMGTTNSLYVREST